MESGQTIENINKTFSLFQVYLCLTSDVFKESFNFIICVFTRPIFCNFYCTLSIFVIFYQVRQRNIIAHNTTENCFFPICWHVIYEKNFSSKKRTRQPYLNLCKFCLDDSEGNQPLPNSLIDQAVICNPKYQVDNFSLKIQLIWILYTFFWQISSYQMLRT